MEVQKIYDSHFTLNPPVDTNKGTIRSVLQMLTELGLYILVVPVMLVDKLVTAIRGDDSATAQKVAEVVGDEFVIMEDDGMDVQDSNRESAVANLKSDEMLTNNTVLQYLEHLGVEYKDHFISSNPGSYEDFLHKLPEKLEQTIYIPVVLKGTFGKNHIVIITINPDSTFEYYDPKGDSCEGKKKLLNFPDKTVENLMTDIVSKYDGGDRPNQNTNKQQKDHYSCGVFVLNYIHERENGKTFDDIVGHPINPSCVRQKLVDTFEGPRRPEENLKIAKELKDKNSILNFLNYEETNPEVFKGLLIKKNSGILHIPVALGNGQVILFTVDHPNQTISRYCPQNISESDIGNDVTFDVLGPIREMLEEYSYTEKMIKPSVLGYLQNNS